MSGSGTLAGKVAVVTGAATGVGRGIAVAFARAGARVVVGDLTEAVTEGNFDERPDLSTTALIAEGGGEAAFVCADVTRAEGGEALADTATARFGRLDVWVNNAGVYRSGPFHELPEAALDACVSVIAKGSWFGAQSAIRRFLAQNAEGGGGGSILNIVSTAGLKGHAFQVPYNMAKGAQAQLTRALALEYAGQGIRVNAICPTYLKTAMSRGGFESEFDAQVRRAIPLGRWGEIEDVATLAVFLASDASAFIQGALIPVDGGEVLGAAS